MIKKVNPDETVIQKAGEPWKTVGIFSDYQKALEKKEKISIEMDNIQLKIKRFGEGGKQFVVKMRKDPNVVEIDKKTFENKKKNKKQKLKSRGWKVGSAEDFLKPED
jgi:electron transfer flavoprotein alpha subunit